MPTHMCENCERVFKQKGHLDSHKKRKNPCKKDNKIEKLVEEKVKEALKKLNRPTTYTKPFLKWVGGKTQILNDVLNTFPSKIQNYHEPFLGGGSVLLGLLSSPRIQVTGKIYASDLNKNLIGLYKNVQSNVEDLISELTILVDEFSNCTGTIVNRKPTTKEHVSPETYYFWIRSQFNALTDKSTASASAMMLFLNKTCFRGVYREGPRGFNVPFGNYKNPGILDEAHLRSVSALIQNVIFEVRPFAESLSIVKSGDFVYLDPPYAPETSTSFVSYNADGFNLSSHEQLFEMCKNLKNVKMAMSNADVKIVRDAFSPPMFKTTVISCRRAINSKNPEAVTNEVLITN